MHYPHAQPYDNEDDRELFDNLFAVASSMECTGLIPAAPDSSAEVDSYSDIYDIPLSKNSVNMESAKKRKAGSSHNKKSQ